MERSDGWISTQEFADRAGLSRQAARQALERCISGKTWRNAQLTVRRRITRGGSGGLGYEVAIDSLPVPLRADAENLGAEIMPSPSGAPAPTSGTAAKWGLIAPALEHAPGSAERGHAVRKAALTSGLSERTLYRWLGRYEAKGLRGLARSRPTGSGKPRVIVSRQFDQAFVAAGYSTALHQKIGAELDKAVKSLWASRAEQAGAPEVLRLAEFRLLELCQQYGLAIPQSACRLSIRRVLRHAVYRVVNQRRNDRKAFDDARPRIRRDWTGLAPMERVVADVKHLDVVVQRPDGSPAWPKIVAFMDAGTGRLFVHCVLTERGEGVRQEHIVEAFLGMVADPAWGFPQGLYLDNGKEFGALTKIDAALQLLNDPGARTIVFARPYNASAKPIESLFARLDRQVFSLLPGYAGPNRMAKKTQTVGKPPAPFPGDWDAFRDTVCKLIEAHNLRPVGGQWRGLSPQEWWRKKVEDGWRPARVDLASLDAAFAEHASRRLDRGVLKINGRRYTHPELAALPSRTVIDLALPWRRGAEPLARVGDRWLPLQQEILYPARWIEGGRESGKRQRAQNRFVSRLEKDVEPIDPVALKTRWARHTAASPPLPAGRNIDLGQEPRRPSTMAKPELSAEERRWRREMALTERLEQRERDD